MYNPADAGSLHKGSFFGIALIAAAVIMQQILLTRLFSSTMYYHHAFAILSLAMLGLTVGGIAVFVFPHRFPYRRTADNLALFCCLAGVSVTIALLCKVSFPFLSSLSINSILLNFALFVPVFCFAGTAVTLALSAYHEQISRLYAWDLCGAGAACVVVIGILHAFGAVNGIFLNAFIMLLAGLFFFDGDPDARLKRALIFTAALIGGIFIANTALKAWHKPHLRVDYSYKNVSGRLEHELWNSYSHIGVFYSHGKRKIKIDFGAATRFYRDGKYPMQKFTDTVSAAAYHMRKPDSAVIIGVGGGKDILSALGFHTPRILGIEINNNIYRLITDNYADFIGRLHERPGVTLINAEARSYLAQQSDRFGLIQVAMIDTWAATAAGAFALSENGLYTLEGWQTFYDRLAPQGMLSFTRWYYGHTTRGELYQMLVLAKKLLERDGITDYRDHLIALSAHKKITLIVSKSPISHREVMNMRQFAGRIGGRVILSPNSAIGEITNVLKTGYTSPNSPRPVQVVTDDRPFFFQTLSFLDVFSLFDLKNRYQRGSFYNSKSVDILLILMLTTSSLAMLLVTLPFWQQIRQGCLRHYGKELGYFFCIGFGFMFIEVAQMQRLIIYLGNPTYALSVVLFTLLVASGIGSLTTHDINATRAKRRLQWLIAALLATGVLTPLLLTWTRHLSDMWRILTGVLLLAPMGFSMGMCFPVAVQHLRRTGQEKLIPWMWSVNGAASVMGAVWAAFLSIFFGISVTFWAGCAFYAIAFLLYVACTKRRVFSIMAS